MNKKLIGALLAAGVMAAPAMAADQLAGATIAATYNGLASGIAGFNGTDYATGLNTVALSSDIEFFSSDYSIAVDFDTTGLVTIYNNTNSAGTTSGILDFVFSGLSGSVSSFSAVDASAVSASGSFLTVLSGNEVQIDLSKLSWSSAEFPTLTAQIAVGAVPEPSTYAMLLAGLGALACVRRRRA